MRFLTLSRHDESVLTTWSTLGKKEAHGILTPRTGGEPVLVGVVSVPFLLGQ